MENNLRLELSFKNILQLEKKINFCLSNKINKINIPCKGLIKKELLNETLEYIGTNYKELDVIYHYSLQHQYHRNRETSYIDFLNFIKKCIFYKNNEILLVSGSNKKKNFEVLDVLSDFKNEKNLDINIGISYNPYHEKYYNFSEEKARYEKKISFGLTKSIWLQFGTDIKLLKSEINYLKKFLDKSKSNNNQNVKFFGSVLIPSNQFIARFKFRPWKGVYISEEYLNSLDSFNGFIKDLINLYLENDIFPLIETECSSTEKLNLIYSLFNN